MILCFWRPSIFLFIFWFWYSPKNLKTFERKNGIFLMHFPKTISGNKNHIYLWPVVLDINFVCIANNYGHLKNITYSIKNYYFNKFDWKFRVLIRLRKKRPSYVCVQNVSNKLSAVVFELAKDMHGGTFDRNFLIKKFLGVHFFLDCEQQTFNWCCRNNIFWVPREIENFFGRNSTVAIYKLTKGCMKHCPGKKWKNVGTLGQMFTTRVDQTALRESKRRKESNRI